MSRPNVDHERDPGTRIPLLPIPPLLTRRPALQLPSEEAGVGDRGRISINVHVGCCFVLELLTGCGMSIRRPSMSLLACPIR